MPAASRQVRTLPAWGKPLVLVLAIVLPVAILELLLVALGVPTVLEREDPFRGFSGMVPVFQRDSTGAAYTSSRPANEKTFNAQTFLADKPVDGFRVFVIGGSSAYGFPWGEQAAFSSILEEVLQAEHPGRTIEVINASGISYASHRLRILVRELLHYQPDVLVIYSGHNEFVEKNFYRSLRRRTETLSRVQHLLYRSHLYGALHGLLGRPSGREKHWTTSDDGLLQLNVRRDSDEGVDAAERRRLEAFFADNLTAILHMADSQGVQVLVCTTPSNLRDWKPERPLGWPLLAAQERRQWEALEQEGRAALEAGHHADAVKQLQDALALAPEDAPSWFLLGRGHEGLGQWADARHTYQRACEFDLNLSRATEGINRAIRRVAAQENIILVDVEGLFTELSPNGLVGFNLIQDYVHPTREAHEHIAFALWESMRAANLPAAPRESTPKALFAKILEARRSQDSSSDNTATFLYNQGMLLANQARWEGARQKLQESVDLAPTWADAHFSLGSVLTRLGDLEAAEDHFQRAAELDPEVADMAVAHYNLGVALARRGDRTKAIDQFRRTLELSPDHVDAHNNLGALLAQRGSLQEAAAHLEAALRLRPDDLKAKKNLERLQAALQKKND